MTEIMPETPTVSLQMTAYRPQREWFLEAVRSALAQRDCSFELVLVDDGSPEPVASLLEGVSDPRLRLIRVEHGGVSHARNAGIAAARGSFLRFLDADDFFPPASTATLLGLAAGDSEEVVACGATRWCRADLSPVWNWPASSPRDGSRSYLLMRSIPMLPSMLFPKRIVDTVGPWDQRYAVTHDTDFILRALEHAPVVETREVMTWYRQHPTSLSKNPAERWNGAQLLVEEYFKRHPEERGRGLRRQAESMLDVLAAEIARPRFPWGHRRFWRALLRDPTTVKMVLKGQLEPRLRRTWTRIRRGGPFLPRRWRRDA